MANIIATEVQKRLFNTYEMKLGYKMCIMNKKLSRDSKFFTSLYKIAQIVQHWEAGLLKYVNKKNQNI